MSQPIAIIATKSVRGFRMSIKAYGLSVVLFLHSVAFAEDLQVMLAFVEGDVRVDKSRGRDGDFVKLGAQIITAAKSRCSLLVGRSTVVRIAENTTLVLSEKEIKNRTQENASLNLKKGQVRALVGKDSSIRKSLNIKSRSSVMGVRGTDVYVSAPESPEEPVLFATLEGAAEVRLGGESEPVVELKENESISMSTDESPAETREIPDEVKAEISEALSGPIEVDTSASEIVDDLNEAKDEFEETASTKTEEAAGQDARDEPVQVLITVNFN